MMQLNASQRQSILFGFLDVHRRMIDLEAMVAQQDASGPFSQYTADISPTEAKVLRDYFARIRTTMLACLRENDIPVEVRRTSLRWGQQVGLTSLSIAVAEISPRNLAGYGPLGPEAEAGVLKIQQELRRLIDRAAAYLRQGAGQDLAQRLARLDTAPAGATTLVLLDRVIGRWQLVEFRPLLDTTVRRLEHPQFEVAVFGRVSSGKSSLLNHIAGADVLPVGVTPVTAVLTRLARGGTPAAVVSFAEASPQAVPLSRLGDYASEEGNPGNSRHVTDVLVRLPSPRLLDGVVFVDTPGVGSLARAGSAETFAYLPRCDLGVVLVDAATTLTRDDLDLLRLLSEAGVAAQVLISKADLLKPSDRERMAGYVRDELKRELGLDLHVHLVSTVGSDEALLSRWFEGEIEPLFRRHRELTLASLRRKVAHLRESVVTVLQTLLARQGRPQQRDGRPAGDLAAARRALDEADMAAVRGKAGCNECAMDVSALADAVFQDATQQVVTDGRSSPPEGDPVARATREVLAGMGQRALDLVNSFKDSATRALAEVERHAPGVKIDADPLQAFAPRGLPVVDLPRLAQGTSSRCPWWSSSLPTVASAWLVRRGLERKARAAVTDLVGDYEKLLRVWLKTTVAQVVDLYGTQADVAREQLRRLTARTEQAPEEMGDANTLHADLRALEDAGRQETPPDASEVHSSSEQETPPPKNA
jgi:GTP-binding protein EngB required for normal cell division